MKAYNCNKFKNFNCIPYIQLLYRTVNKQPKKSSTLLLAFSGDRSPATTGKGGRVETTRVKISGSLSVGVSSEIKLFSGTLVTDIWISVQLS